jgi:uncharacterized OsmC-like protein
MTMQDDTAPAPAAARDRADYVVTGETQEGRTSALRLGGRAIACDTRWNPDEPLDLPGPAHLLGGALAACLLKGLERSRALLPFEFDHAEVQVTATRRDVPPAFTAFHYVVRLVTDEEPRRVDLLHRNLTEFGTVVRTLSAAAEVTGEIVVVPRS